MAEEKAPERRNIHLEGQDANVVSPNHFLQRSVEEDVLWNVWWLAVIDTPRSPASIRKWRMSRSSGMRSGNLRQAPEKARQWLTF